MVACWWCRSNAATVLWTAILSLQWWRSTSGSTSRPGQARPWAAASGCWLHALLASSRLVTVRAHGERCRHIPCSATGGGCYVTDVRGFLGRGDSFTEHPIHVSVVLMGRLNFLMGQNFFVMSRFGALVPSAHHEHYDVKGLTPFLSWSCPT